MYDNGYALYIICTTCIVISNSEAIEDDHNMVGFITCNTVWVEIFTGD